MKFWKRLRLIGSLTVLAIAVLATVLEVLRTPQADDDGAPSQRPAHELTSQAHTTGL